MDDLSITSGIANRIWRVALWGSFLAILIAPLVAMQFTGEVHWTPFDFAVAAVLLGGHFLRERNLLQRLCEKLMISGFGRVVALGAAQWTRLNLAFVLYFMALGGLNLFIAYTFSTDFWVNFKLFGFTAIQMVFYVAVFLYFYRHISEEDRKQLFHQEKSAEEPKKKDDDAVRDNQ